MKPSHVLQHALDGAFFILGSLLFAASVNIFTAPNDIAPGGVTGAAILLNSLLHFPIGVTTIALNIPLFIWGIHELGWQPMVKSAIAVVISSLAIDLGEPFLPAYHGDPMLVSIFGGVLAGAGLALIFMRGGTTGGTDLAANLLGQRFRHISLGRLLLLIDLPIVLLSIPVFHSMESPMYALIVIFITTKVIDTVLYGTDAGTGKLMFIISKESEKIKHEILYTLSRGVTELRARGSYTGQENEVLLVAVRRPEVYHTYDLIHAADPDAFIIVADAGEITGEGFKTIRR